jgi:hypothetical protein
MRTSTTPPRYPSELLDASVPVVVVVVVFGDPAPG